MNNSDTRRTSLVKCAEMCLYRRLVNWVCTTLLIVCCIYLMRVVLAPKWACCLLFVTEVDLFANAKSNNLLRITIIRLYSYQPLFNFKLNACTESGRPFRTVCARPNVIFTVINTDKIRINNTNRCTVAVFGSRKANSSPSGCFNRIFHISCMHFAHSFARRHIEFVSSARHLMTNVLKTNSYSYFPVLFIRFIRCSAYQCF